MPVILLYRASVVKKLTTINPDLLSSRFSFEDLDMPDRPVGMSFIQVAIKSMGWDVDFEVCKGVLIEAEPLLLLKNMTTVRVDRITC
jgi:hypothetical protein